MVDSPRFNYIKYLKRPTLPQVRIQLRTIYDYFNFLETEIVYLSNTVTEFHFTVKSTLLRAFIVLLMVVVRIG